MVNNVEVRTIITNLPTKVKGFVYLDSTGIPCIVLNARMPVEIQQKTFQHEMNHILRGEMTNANFKEYTA